MQIRRLFNLCFVFSLSLLFVFSTAPQAEEQAPEKPEDSVNIDVSAEQALVEIMKVPGVREALENLKIERNVALASGPGTCPHWYDWACVGLLAGCTNTPNYYSCFCSAFLTCGCTPPRDSPSPPCSP